jgi:hypothetical protein
MKIWRLTYDSTHCDTLCLINPQEGRYFTENFHGVPLPTHLFSLNIQIETYKERGWCDCSGFGGGVPVLSEGAVNVLWDLMEGKVEKLPLHHERGTYFAINVINVKDAIDFEKAIVTRDHKYPDVVKEIATYAFIPEKIIGEHIFKTPQFRGTRVYVSDEFRKRVLENNLTGFEFTLLANTDSTEEIDDSQVEEVTLDGISYQEATELLLAGKAIASGKWKLQKNKKGNIRLGQLVRGTYEWIDPLYYPPIFHDLKWKEVELSDL